MANSTFEQTLSALPSDLKREVEDFAAFLLAKHLGNSVARTGEKHPLAGLAGAWRDESLSDAELLPERTAGRDVEL